MKTNLSVLLVVSILFFVTACEFNSQEASTVLSTDELELLAPFEGEEVFLLERGETPARSKENTLIQMSADFNSVEKARSITRARRFGDDATNSSAQARFEESTIRCGTSLSASTEDYDINAENDPQYRKDDDFYIRHNLNTNLDGNDRSFYLFVTEPKNYTFNLSNTTNNLAMLIFSANLTSPADNGTEEATEETTGLVAFSTSNSTTSEKIGPVFLDKGEYLIVVDSKPGKGSSFNLRVSCQNVNVGCSGEFGTGLIADGFEQYKVFEDVTQMSSNWEDYSPNLGFETFIYNVSGKGKTLRVQRRRSGTTASVFEPNVVFLLGERNFGKYALEFDLGVYRGRSAYFNLVNSLSERNANNEVGAELVFPSNGRGYAMIGGQRKNFTYRNGYWQRIKLVWNFGANKVELYIQGNKVADWAANSLNVGGTGTGSVEGVNFLPAFNNSVFIVDNFCFSQD